MEMKSKQVSGRIFEVRDEGHVLSSTETLLSHIRMTNGERGKSHVPSHQVSGREREKRTEDKSFRDTSAGLLVTLSNEMRIFFKR